MPQVREQPLKNSLIIFWKEVVVKGLEEVEKHIHVFKVVKPKGSFSFVSLYEFSRETVFIKFFV